MARGQVRGRRVGDEPDAPAQGRPRVPPRVPRLRPTGPRPTPCSSRSGARIESARPAATGGSSTTWSGTATSLPNASYARPDRAGPPVPRRAPREPVAGRRWSGLARRLRQDPRRPRHRQGPRLLEAEPDRLRPADRPLRRLPQGPQANGGRHISEATEAKDRVLRAWDDDTYRRAYDHLVAHPNDVAEVARQLARLHQPAPRRPAGGRGPTLRQSGGTRCPSAASIGSSSAAGTSRPSLARPSVAHPTSSVVLEVAGVTYGPSPVIKQ